jgi:hypothetical protein
MAPLELTATQFIQPMKNGRNKPLLLGCEDQSGKAFEVVVKLRGREMTEKAQIAELISAQLAADLGVDVPRSAVVEVSAGFEAIVTDKDAAEAVKNSTGMNFGTEHLGTDFTTWPPGRNPTSTQRTQAVAIFAFDTLVQNPDRKAENPNLWVRSGSLGVYDHELAFAPLHLPIIGGAPKPWNIAHAGAFDFLAHHIFYKALKGGVLDLTSFEERLSNLTDDQIAGYVASVPMGWRRANDLCEKIAEYLCEARQERGKLIHFIKHLLRR